MLGTTVRTSESSLEEMPIAYPVKCMFSPPVAITTTTVRASEANGHMISATIANISGQKWLPANNLIHN